MIFLDGRYFCHHSLWEDARNGLYELNKICEIRMIKCLDMFKNQELFWDVMCQMRIDWPNSFKVNVSNNTINRQAWLGQASCCYNYGACATEVIKYWNMLNIDEKENANKTAQRMIDLFRKEELNAKSTFGNRCFDRCTRTIEMDF